MADISPIKLNYPVLLIKDNTRLLMDTFSELEYMLRLICSKTKIPLSIYWSLSIVGFSLRTRSITMRFLKESVIALVKSLKIISH